MTLVTCEFTWLKKLLKNLKFEESSQMHRLWNNHAYTLSLILSFMRGQKKFKCIVIS